MAWSKAQPIPPCRHAPTCEPTTRARCSLRIAPSSAPEKFVHRTSVWDQQSEEQTKHFQKPSWCRKPLRTSTPSHNACSAVLKKHLAQSSGGMLALPGGPAYGSFHDSSTTLHGLECSGSGCDDDRSSQKQHGPYVEDSFDLGEGIACSSFDELKDACGEGIACGSFDEFEDVLGEHLTHTLPPTTPEHQSPPTLADHPRRQRATRVFILICEPGSPAAKVRRVVDASFRLSHL